MRAPCPVFSITILLGAALLFGVQPLIAKFLLPWFGGSPGVWTTCLLFFQGALVGGYAYAHGTIAAAPPREQRRRHLMLLAVSLVVMGVWIVIWHSPILPPASWKPAGMDAPVATLLAVLAAAIGLPYLLLAATGPMLQAWFTQSYPGAAPWRLYALSNLGSLLGLIAYPLAVEPLLGLRAQAIVWSAAYVVYAAGCWRCAHQPIAAGETAHDARVADERLPRTRVALWLALAACPSLLLCATTNELCQEVAPVPLLWILPLALYLLSFIVCFSGERWYSRYVWFPMLAFVSGWTYVVLSRGIEATFAAQLIAYPTLLFAAAMACHGELFRRRPAPARLTAFYLTVASGGAIGSAFVAILAPRIFSGFFELHLGMWLAGALMAGILVGEHRRWITGGPPVPAIARAARLIALAIPVVAVIVFGRLLLTNARSANSGAFFVARNFYGVISVQRYDEEDAQAARDVLTHGRIEHGHQLRAPALRDIPASYYTESSGLGLAILNHPRRAAARDQSLRIGVVGLGVGTSAAYGLKGDVVRFYEINPAVVRLSLGQDRIFTYIKDSPARVDVVQGDARLSLERELNEGHPQNFDVLAIDAFSSDSIPVHLLTREAIQVYLQHLRSPSGILAVHISNRYLELEPVVRGAASALGLAVAVIESRPGEDKDPDASASTWVLLAPNPGALAVPAIERAAMPSAGARVARLWTDTYSNLLSVVAWKSGME
jgi:hypothetical protein